MEPSSTRPSDSVESALTPPQFGTRKLLAWIAILGLVLAIARRFSPISRACMLLFAGAVIAHIAGNAIGTKLRAAGTATGQTNRRPMQRPKPHQFAPRSRLSDHRRLSWWMWSSCIISALVAGIGGGSALAQTVGDKATVGNVSLAVVSSAILGGLIGFWVSSFMHIFIDALRQAHRDADPHPSYVRRVDSTKRD